MARSTKSVAERFWPKVERRGPDECWGWTASKHKFGYGKVSEEGRPRSHRGAHRVSWEIHNGPIPEGLCVLHRCDNPACVNPRHLFLGTHADNVHDMIAKGRDVRPSLPGERNPGAKLTAVQVRAIRRHMLPRFSRKRIAEMYGVSVGAIHFIARGRTWKAVA